MATSAFKSTTKRAATGASSSDDSSSRAGRRSRSLIRYSCPTEPQLDAPRGRVANAQCPEISLDDLALELFSSSSSMNENGSDGGIGLRKERQGRSVSRLGDVGRWAGETASSRRKSRSVSRTRGNASSGPALSERKVSSSSDAAGPRRRRSASVSRSQSKASYSQSSSNWVDAKTPVHGNGHLVPTSAASSNRRLGRTQSYKDFSMSLDGYSSHSSALTDDETKDTRVERNGHEKIILSVYAQKKPEHPTEDVANGGLYEVMRQELRHAVEEIRTELNHVMGRNQTAENSHHDLSGIRRKHLTKPEQLPDKHKQDILIDRGPSQTVNEVQRPSRARKRSSDRYRVSNKLTEEAQRYFEGFISNIEDTDISSFDGERSDASSTLGGTRMQQDSTIRTTETHKNSCPETDGVILPWLQWETAHDAPPSTNTNGHTPITPESIKWCTQKDTVSALQDSSNCWSMGVFSSAGTRETATAALRQIHQSGNDGTSSYDSDRYLSLKLEEEVVFQVYRERNRVNAGGILLCGSSVLW